MEGALACAIIVLVGVELSGSVAAATAAALLFATSYTFWSQSIIAEVYALHLIFVALTLLLALRWARQPSLWRLALLFAAYAIGFGNHLSMILLAPGVVIFLFAGAPDGWRSMLTPRVLGAGRWLARAPARCSTPGTSIRSGCFPIHRTARSTRFNVSGSTSRKPIGAKRWCSKCRGRWRAITPRCMPSICASNSDGRDRSSRSLGLAALVRTNWRQAALMFAVYVVNVLFAFGYNVGDTHVFYLPSHLMVALLAAPALVLVGQRASPAPSRGRIAYCVRGGTDVA